MTNKKPKAPNPVQNRSINFPAKSALCEAMSFEEAKKKMIELLDQAEKANPGYSISFRDDWAYYGEDEDDDRDYFINNIYFALVPNKEVQVEYDRKYKEYKKELKAYDEALRKDKLPQEVEKLKKKQAALKKQEEALAQKIESIQGEITPKTKQKKEATPASKTIDVLF